MTSKKPRSLAEQFAWWGADDNPGEYTRLPMVKQGFQYAQDVVDGKIASGKYVRLACARFLYMAADKKAPYVFVPKYAELFFHFVGGCKQVKGRWAGAEFALYPWQCLAINMIYGFRHRHDESLRWTTIFFFFLTRKSGKSMLTSLIALYELVWGSGGRLPNGGVELANEVYTVGTDTQTAQIVFLGAWATIDSMIPALARHYKRTYLKISRSSDVLSQFRALSRNVHKTADGKSVQCALIDEAAQITNRAGIDVLESGMGSRRSPLLCYLTTASHTKETRFYQDYTYYKNVLSGNVPDNTKWNGLLFEMDEGDDWQDESTWYKTSPMLGHTISIEYLRDQARLAQDVPEKLPEFLTKHLNVWVSSMQSFVDLRFWQACPRGRPMQDGVPEEPIARFMAFDLAAVKDLNAICLVEMYEGERYYVSHHYFLPQAGFAALPDHYKPIFRAAQKRGSLVLTPGNSIDMEVIHNFILAELDGKDYTEIGYDLYNANYLTQKLDEQGYPLKLVGQSVRALNAPTKYLERLILNGKNLHHDHDPFTAWQLANCQLWVGNDKTNTNQNVKLVRNEDDRHAKIDGIIAMVMAFHCVLDNNQIMLTYGLEEL